MSSSPVSFQIASPTAETLPALTRLTRTLLPINYPDKFFTQLLQAPNLGNAYSLAKVAIWRDPSVSTAGYDPGQVVAGICGRILPAENPIDGECQLYIATLAVLAPWRGQGIAAALLRELVSAALAFTSGGSIDVMGHQVITDSSTIVPEHQAPSLAPPLPSLGLGRLTTVFAHVWETNDSGLDWYQAQGFEIGDVIKGYYRKLRPDGARLVRRGVLGLLLDGNLGGSNPSGLMDDRIPS